MRRITGVRRLLVVSVLALVVAVPGVAGASASRGAAPGTKLTFSTPGFQWLNHQGGGQYYIWNVGDYWRQSFTATGLTSINRIKFSLSFDNVLCSSNPGCGSTVQVNVIVNGHTLAHPTFVEGQDSFITRVISLPTPIPGPDYMVEFLETNQVPLGNGSVSLYINGPSYVVIGSA